MEAIKEAMTQYWGCRAEKFSDLRRREFAGEKHRQWAAELDRYIPSGRKLRILDIGTGTGFFAFLLAERGHAVTAIDLTPEPMTPQPPARYMAAARVLLEILAIAPRRIG